MVLYVSRWTQMAALPATNTGAANKVRRLDYGRGHMGFRLFIRIKQPFDK